jgi:hypothetical protein
MHLAVSEMTPVSKIRYVWIALVLASMVGLLIFGGTAPVAPTTPAGVRLQSVIEQVASTVEGKVQPETCRMMGNLNISVTCRVEGARIERMHEALRREGWSVADGTPGSESTVYVRNDIRLLVHADRSGVVVTASPRPAGAGS